MDPSEIPRLAGHYWLVTEGNCWAIGYACRDGTWELIHEKEPLTDDQVAGRFKKAFPIEPPWREFKPKGWCHIDDFGGIKRRSGEERQIAAEGIKRDEYDRIMADLARLSGYTTMDQLELAYAEGRLEKTPLERPITMLKALMRQVAGEPISDEVHDVACRTIMENQGMENKKAEPQGGEDE
jgi:hypothetical protein